MNVEKFAALEVVRRNHPEGKLMPKDVVIAAKDQSNPLHGDFEWDDSLAAEAYREQQARQIIRAAITFEPRLQKTARAYLSLPSDRSTGGGYRSTSEVLGNDGWINQLVEEVRAKIASMKNGYAHLPQLQPLFQKLEAEVALFLLDKQDAA
jgi:hypothetical protein